MAKPRKRKTKADAPGADAAGIGDNSEKAVLTPDEKRQLFLSHRSSWAEYRAKVAAAEEFGKDVKAALKSDGFSVKDMQIADALVNDDTKVVAEVRNRLEIASWLGHPMGHQLEMFDEPDRTPVTDRAYDDGKMASMSDKQRKPPHSPETEAYRAWMAGYDDHQRELVGGMRAPADENQSTLANRQ